MRVLLVDQFDICREGMKAVLLQMDKECSFLEAGSIEEGVAAAGDLDLDMIIIDLDVPEVGCMGMLQKIENSKLMGKIVLFSMTEDYAVMRKAYEMGICAFIGEQTKKIITISVFQIVLAGGKYFSPEVIGGRPEIHSKRFNKQIPDCSRRSACFIQSAIRCFETFGRGQTQQGHWPGT